MIPLSQFSIRRKSHELLDSLNHPIPRLRWANRKCSLNNRWTMNFVIHVTLNYPEGEEIEYEHKASGFRNLAEIAEGYLREDQVTSWVFVVTKEESNDH